MLCCSLQTFVRKNMLLSEKFSYLTPQVKQRFLTGRLSKSKNLRRKRCTGYLEYRDDH